jgi:catechol 2,3-dioxygenase-like lactoylglutathione lyase family enzyme
VARLDQHVALRVTDVERATRFWVEALDGRPAGPPASGRGGYLDELFGAGCRLRLAYVLFEAGAVELFEFEEPRVAVPPSRQVADGLMHFGVHVPDAAAALARVEAAGGRARSAVHGIRPGDDAPRFVYCEDPDGHVFELMEADSRRTAAELARMVDARRGSN